MASSTEPPDSEEAATTDRTQLGEGLPAHLPRDEILSDGDLAFDPMTGRTWIVLEVLDEEAAECRVDPSGTLTDWSECRDDDPVFRAVEVATLRSKAEEFHDLGDVRYAVQTGRVFAHALPAARLAPVPGKNVLIRDETEGRI